MAHVITFRSTRFDPAAERRNPINPIAGEGLLRWLAERLAEHGYTATTPEPEDWGWYIDVSRAGVSYLVGASGEGDDAGAGVRWVVQVHRHRSLGDRITGRNRLAGDDPLSGVVQRVAGQVADAAGIEVEREP